MSRVDRALQKAHASMDGAWQNLLAQNEGMGERRVDIACTKGCAGCCTYVVDALDVEAAHLVDLIASWPTAKRAAAVKRIQDAYVEWTAFAKANPEPAHDDVSKQARWRARWQVRRAACPLLDLDTYTCSVYAARPATCRGHHAGYPTPQVLAEAPENLTTPPDGCLYDQAEHPIAVWQIRDDLAVLYMMEVIQTVQRENVTWSGGTLIPLLMTEGHRRHGWPMPKGRREPMPTLDHSRLAEEVPS